MAYTTKYTGNFDYYRAYMEYQITKNTTNYVIDVKYGIALYSGYSSSTWDGDKDRYVSVSVGTSPSGASSYNIFDLGWIRDETYLDASNWWHQTGTTSITITRTTASQSIVLKIWGKKGSDASGGSSTAYITITVPALPSYTITYSASGASNVPENATKYYGKTITLSSTKPTKDGHSFSSWKATDGTLYQPKASYTKNEGTTLTAQWTVYTKTFKFNANNGTGTMSNQVISYASSGTTNLTNNAFTRDNYNFTGWNTQPDGSGTSYTNQQSISRNTITSDSTINLYAQWSLAYIAPKITKLEGIRSEENSANATINIDWTKGNNGSDIASTQLSIAYKLNTSNTWTYVTSAGGTSSSQTWISSSETTYSTTISGLSEGQYDIQATVRNSNYTSNATSKSNYISSTFYTIDINVDGSAIGLLQPVTDNNSGIYINNMILMKDSFLLTATDSQNKNAIIRARQTDGISTTQSSIALLANTNNNHGLYSDTHDSNGQWLIYSDNTDIYIGGSASSPINGDIYIKGKKSAVTIISSGTTSDWTWKKYSDNTFECYKYYSFTPTESTQTGQNYYSNTVTVPLPFTIVSGIPSVICTRMVCWPVNMGVATTNISFRIARSSAISTTDYMGVFITVHGTY